MLRAKFYLNFEFTEDKKHTLITLYFGPKNVNFFSFLLETMSSHTKKSHNFDNEEFCFLALHSKQ